MGAFRNFDAQGRLRGLRVGDIGSLHETLRAVVEGGTSLPDALRLVTENPAASLKLSPAKGRIAEGSDADVVVLDRDLTVEQVFARGRCVVAEGGPSREAPSNSRPSAGRRLRGVTGN